MGKTVVVIGGGGRESTLVKKYSQSPKVERIIAIPGNDLMPDLSTKNITIFPSVSIRDIKKIISICKKEKVDLVDVAQDDAIEAGLVDSLEENGFKVFGPSRDAGQIEWDKAWARSFMKKYKLPIPTYKVFNDKHEALNFVKKNPSKKWFIKASGLAAGKGVIFAGNINEAKNAILEMKRFGKSGETFVVEECLVGEEFSFFAITDGISFNVLGSAQDHKKLYDGDHGPNTGGMGAYSNPSVVTHSVYKQAEKIINKTIKGLKKEGRVYKGILYLGAMVVKGKVYIIEFNARWGDPEAQVLIPSLKVDLYDLAGKVSDQKLDTIKIIRDLKSRIVVAGSLREGMKDKKRELRGVNNLLKSKEISFLSTRVYKQHNKYYVTSGRLFYLVSSGRNIIDARKRVYSAMSSLFIEENGLHYRTDIGWREVSRIKTKQQKLEN